MLWCACFIGIVWDLHQDGMFRKFTSKGSKKDAAPPDPELAPSAGPSPGKAAEYLPEELRPRQIILLSFITRGPKRYGQVGR